MRNKRLLSTHSCCKQYKTSTSREFRESFISKAWVPRRLYREHEEEEKRKNYEQEIDEESSLILSRTWKTNIPVSLQTGKNRLLGKTEITMTFEKLYYDPSHYASYSAVDNLTRAVKPNFSQGEVVRWLESQDAYTLHRSLRRKFPHFAEIALQRNKHWRCVGDRFDRTPKSKKLQWLFLSASDYRCTK